MYLPMLNLLLLFIISVNLLVCLVFTCGFALSLFRFSLPISLQEKNHVSIDSAVFKTDLLVVLTRYLDGGWLFGLITK